jgi:hypothetical protein
MTKLCSPLKRQKEKSRMVQSAFKFTAQQIRRPNREDKAPGIASKSRPWPSRHFFAGSPTIRGPSLSECSMCVYVFSILHATAAMNRDTRRLTAAVAETEGEPRTRKWTAALRNYCGAVARSGGALTKTCRNCWRPYKCDGATFPCWRPRVITPSICCKPISLETATRRL